MQANKDESTQKWTTVDHTQMISFQTYLPYLSLSSNVYLGRVR